MIRTDDLSIRYGPVSVIRGVSLSIKKGEIAAIVGPSGCGKSSFLSAINRMTDLIPSADVQGTIQIDACDVNDPGRSATELRRTVGMIFQKPNPFPMSIRRNIQLALREHGVRDRSSLEEITERVLRDVGLWEEVCDRLDDSALTLSGGQQQRLCIARALALEPQVLLMDEPCSALDPLAAERVESLIQNMRGKYTIVIVTHNLAQARRIADQLAVFWVKDNVGQVVAYGPTEQLFEDAGDPLAAAYLSGRQG